MIRPLPFRALILCLVGAWVQQASGEAVPATKEYEEGLAAENRNEAFSPTGL
jgi:hypothetical protein